MKRLSKICMLVNDLDGGGAEHVLVKLANGLTHRGIHVDIVMVNSVDVYSHLLIAKNILCLQTRCTIIRTPLVILKLLHYLYRNRPDAIISGMESVHHLAAAAHLLHRPSLPMIMILHTTLSKRWQNSSRQEQVAKKLLLRLVLAHQRLIVAVSTSAARDAERFLNKPSETVVNIYNPVVDEKLMEYAALPLFQHSRRQPPVILAVGSLRKGKNFTMLIQAFARAHQIRPCQLIILGDGPMRMRLEALIKSLDVAQDISLPGFVSNVFDYMRSASLYASTSNFEGLPSVIIEAMCCGCPVIATDCPSGPREILEDGKYGTLVPVGDVNVLADVFVRLLDHPPDSRQREAARIRAKEFSVDRATNAYLELFESY